jgi:two-component system response regulator MprA
MEGRLLVVEDDPQVRGMLVRALTYEGFEVEAAEDLATAAAALRARPPDLVLLDLLLPDEDGLELCRRARAEGDVVPILVVTARDEIEDRVEGLDAGADDYMVKPFSTAELVARVRSLLRRARGGPPGGPLRFADLSLDCESREVVRAGREVELTRREFELLEQFLRQPERVLTRDELLAEAWGVSANVETNAIDVYVGYLRRKLEEDGGPRLIWTVRGVGYVLREGSG